MRDDRVLVFDLGGVLVESTGQVALKKLLPHLQDEAQILKRWLDSRAVGLFERGSIGPDEFAKMFIAEWDIRLEPLEFLTVFSAWVRGFYPGAKNLVRNLRAHHTVGCLSNTNAAHWARLAEVQEAFDICIPSHLTGYMKPDSAAYDHALQRLGVPPGNVYFFDDLLPNVLAARSVGMNAFQVRGVLETETALHNAGIDPDACA